MTETVPAEPLEAVDANARERREALTEFWNVVKRLPAYGRLVATMVRDPQVPNRSRAILAAGGAYVVSPFDLVPGIIPVAGQIDDVYVLLMAIRQALRMTPPETGREYLTRYGLDTERVDADLAAIRRLVRVGVTDSARWGWRQANRAGRWVGDTFSRVRSR